MELSVVIVTYNTREMLKACITSIKEKTNDIEYEIIVVDNVSKDNTSEMLGEQFPDVKVIQNTKNTGFSGGNNQGIKAASGTYILIMNPDTQLKTPNGLKLLVEFMKQHPEAGLVAPRLILMKNGTVQRSAFVRFPNVLTFAGEWAPVNAVINKMLPHWDHWGKYYYDVSQLNTVKNVGWAIGAAMLMKKDNFIKTGDFDENIFLLSEDTDLCWKVRNAGYEIFYYPDVELFHHWGANQENLSFTLNCYYNGMGYYLKKHHGDLYRHCCYAITALGSVISIAFYSALRPLWKARRDQFKNQIAWYGSWLKLLYHKASNRETSK
jgi:GT2 family glycosyltransferase